jgi:3-oxoacyl-[acyl-carrier-protein] synthase I
MRLCCTSLVCSVGLTASAACAAIRAGVAGFEELPYYSGSGQPIIGAPIPPIWAEPWNSARAIEHLATAVSECVAGESKESLNATPLLVALAEPERPGGNSELAASIVAEVERRLGVRFHPQLSRAIARGHTAGFEGLNTARELLRQGAVQACVVCGVDSYLNARTLLWLDQTWRLKTKQNSDGVIPGEAAAAVLVLPRAVSGKGPWVTVQGIGFGFEPARPDSEEPLLGVGLTQAARAALEDAGLGLHDIDLRISDVAGESFAFKEQSLMVSRLLRIRRHSLPIWHCADCIGDTGAAAGLCQLVIAFQAFSRNYAPGDWMMCFTSTLAGRRAAVVLKGDPQAGSRKQLAEIAE